MEDKQKSIFITGVSGFIGSAVAKEAIRHGYTVYGLDIKDCNVEGIKFFKVDITNSASVKFIKNVDYVIHLAAVTSNVEFENDPYKCYNINVKGFANIINAAIKSNVKKFLYASSAAVYTTDSGFSEDSVINIKQQRNHYAKSKLMNEMIAESYNDIFKFHAIGVRLFNVYGPNENAKGNYASIISQFLKADKEGKPLVIYGDGSQARDFIYVDDVAKIIIKLLDKADSGVYNVGTGNAIAYKDIANMINKSAIKYVPNPLSSYQYLTKADTSKLISTIGNYKFITVAEGIKKLA